MHNQSRVCSMKGGSDRLSQQNKTSGRDDEKMGSVTPPACSPQDRCPPTSSRLAADRPPTRARHHATPRRDSRCRQPCRPTCTKYKFASTPLVQAKSSWPPSITKSSPCTTILIVLAGWKKVHFEATPGTNPSASKV